METLEKKKKREFPDCFIILFLLIVVVWAASFIIPSGEYARYYDETTGRQVVDATSFAFVEKENLGIFDLLTAVHDGFVQAADIIIMTLLIGAAFGVIKKIGVIDLAVKKLAFRFKDKGLLVIPILMFVFSQVDNFTGTCELCMIYVPVIYPLIIALGFDPITACATALIGSAVGFTAAFANPFTVIISQKLAGLPLYSGALFRIAVYVCTFAVAALYVCNYAKKVRKDPTKSIMYNPDKPWGSASISDIEDVKFTKQQTAAGIGFLAVFAAMIFAVVAFGMGDFNQLDAFFLLLCIVPGILGGLSSKELVDGIMEGCCNMLYGALLIGVARGVSVIMANGGIMDTIVYALATVVQKLPPFMTAIGMQIVQNLINFLIPSGSGQAVVTMPIMLPLADVTGVTRQTAILAYQWGDGLSNIFWPTMGYMIASIGFAGVSYDKWIKWLWKPFILLTLCGWVALVIAQFIGWGPF